jgi:SAM-dependent methyltransferase
MEDRGYERTADLYDQVAAYRDRRTDVLFYVKQARAAGGEVLELGCGTGRVLIPTARAGVRITGLDLSAAMLEVCRCKLAGQPPEVAARAELVHGDMRDFDLGPGRFAVVTIPFRPFQHLVATADQLACLACARRHLAAGGALVFDLFNPSLPSLVDDARLAEWGDEPEFETPAGDRVVRKFRTVERDWLGQVLDLEIIYDLSRLDGTSERIVERFPMRYFFRFEAEHLLARAGFEVEAVYADFDERPYGAVYPGELIFVARRPR